MTVPLLLHDALALHQQNRLAEAEGLYRQLLTAEPGNFEAWHRLAILHYQQQRGGDALAAVNAALKINPGIADARVLQGVLLQAAGRRGEARDAFQAATSLRPGDAQGWYNLGLVHNELKDFQAAVTAFDRVLALKPSAEAWYNRGIALQELRRYPETLESFDRTIALAPGALPALYRRGLALLELGRDAEAVATFDRLLAQDPTVFEAWTNRGAAQQQLKRFADSLVSYDKALALRPNFAQSWSNRAGALWGLKRFEDALSCHDKAVALAPDYAEAWIYRAGVLNAMQRYQEALVSLDRALAIQPDNQAAVYARAPILCESGRIVEAFAVYRAHAERVYGAKDFFAPADHAHKQRHDREQRDYLAAEGIASGTYRLAQGARVAAPAVNPSPAAEEQWRQSNPKVVVIDNFLSAAALEKLRRYCWGSTVWQEVHAEGYLGATPDHGFGCPLLAQIAEELQRRFPAIFAGHGLRKIWAFKYDSSLTGIKIHADQAAVNVNFWITPDEANLDPAHGGMVIWDAAAPLDWDFDQYNGDEAAARTFLTGAKANSRTVPYRANRVVIFDSDLFHETDVIAFKEGYQNRRINITMLFGRRVADGG
jgi:tetratricopeptide (TPR) repeat protein